MAARFEGKVAVVTGGGSGIGRATAMRFASEGAHVFVVDLDAERARSVMAEIGATGGSARAHGADVTRPEDVQAMLAAAEESFGGVDIVCNNAGVATRRPIFAEADEEVWERTLAVNLRGVILGCKYAIPILKRRGGGAIVNTASMAGIVGIPSDPVYGATKGGVVMLTRSLRNLQAEAGIRVNCVCPAFVDTPMVHEAVGAERDAFEGFALIRPEAVAEVIAYLASGEAAGLTGRAVRLVAGEPPMLLAVARPERPLFGG